MRCWCGNTDLASFDAGYRWCRSCQTLVSVRADEPFDVSTFYGDRYWFDHQTRDLGTPDINTRSRTDLADRAAHWMRSLLRFVLPPAKVLEIGCSHGGFVAMMNQAGFDATGLEVNPSIVSIARRTFGVDVLTGPLESQSIPAGTYDAVVMLDVIEHLPDPVKTLTRCLEVLKPGGILFGQTPAYPAGRSLADLTSAGHKFPQMLDPAEHLYLFSEPAIDRLFRQIGAIDIRFVPAVFGFYDQAFFVSRSTLVETTDAGRNEALAATTGGRFVRAMLDIDDRRLELLEKYRQQTRTTAVPHGLGTAGHGRGHGHGHDGSAPDASDNS
jgi:2-polyprenyl-3-methyl-5-hydroxy-6-metoxy-1,4-benzoquinol methylase